MRIAYFLAPFGAVAIFAGGFFACSGSSGAGGPGDASVDALDAGGDLWPPTPDAWNRPVTRPDDNTATQARAACQYEAGALAGETLGPSIPVDVDIPIDTFVVMIQENHSFDQYFSHLGKYAGRSDIESAPDNTTNPSVAVGTLPEGGVDGGAGDAGVHVYQHGPELCFFDTDHSWRGSHLEWDNGINDGFFEANDQTLSLPDAAPPDAGSGDRALWWYDERDIPFYYQLASTFGIADHYHCSLLGPTWPNRMFAYSATSFGLTYNIFPNLSGDAFPDHNIIIFDELEQRHVSWAIYTDSAPGPAAVLGPSIATRYGRDPVRTVERFYSDAAAGTLPQVVYVEGLFGSEGPQGNDEHPPAQIQIGQKYVSDIVHALFQSPQWGHMAFFLTYDENGGLYDHVPPPSACLPDTFAPMSQMGDTAPGTFDRLGFRVPMIVASPYARAGFVGHQVYDHTSILKLIEAKFRIPAMTARDANALPPTEFFDFQNPPFVTPPSIPGPTVDQSAVDFCTAAYPSSGSGI